MAKNIGKTLIIMMIIIKLFMVFTVVDSYSVKGESPKCIAGCTLKCITDGKDRTPWQWAACLANCLITCSDASIDRACATSCAQNMCSKFFNSGIYILITCVIFFFYHLTSIYLFYGFTQI